MEGCLVERGVVFYFDTPEPPSDTIINKIMLQRPNNSTVNSIAAHFDRLHLRYHITIDGRDSVFFLMSQNPYRLNYPTEDDLLLEARFSGVYTDDQTIEGEFQWGFPLEDSVLVACPGIFRRIE